MRDIDSVIEQNCQIAKPLYDEKSRNVCMDFCYYERDLEVFSEFEGLYKTISGRFLVRDFVIPSKNKETKSDS